MANASDPIGKSPLARLASLRRQRRVRNAGTIGLVVLGPVLIAATVAIMGPLTEVTDTRGLRLILLADLIYILVVAALVLRQIARMVAARRARSAGSRLHLRLTGVFAIVALVPTVLVAVFGTITINLGLEGWFSSRVSEALGNSVEAAEAYAQEQRDDLAADAAALAAFLNATRENAARANVFFSDGDLRQVLAEGQSRIQRGLREAFVVDGAGDLRQRGERSYRFDFEQPAPEDLARAAEGELVIIDDFAINELRALLRLQAFNDRFLYVSRDVDGQILSLLDETQQTAQLYRQLENDRGRTLFQFALLYLGFSLIMIVAAVWLGLWFAERLSKPVGRLAGAAQRVGQGDLAVQIPEERGDDEIAMVGRLFNQMTRQLKGQRDALLSQNAATEERRRLFDSVLGSVTSGVIGLDAEGRIDFVNRAAQNLLDLGESGETGRPLAQVVPEFAALYGQLRERRGSVQEEIKIARRGQTESLLVRMATRRDEGGALEGHVVALEDVTDLVSAQRMAAWGDVARRIAHEIKNPLTPIQLSADQVRRKFSRKLDEADAARLSELTDVIVRQTEDLRRIVDEFSKFARMPEPERRPEDLAKLLKNAVVLQQAGQPGITWQVDIPDGPVMAELDATMIGQALTNLMKNAGEATETLMEKGAPFGYRPELRVRLTTGPESVEIEISDNGAGLPEDRSRLFEPYVTTREKGTGLGLPIVKKIVEEHGGSLELSDAEPFTQDAHSGARARITLPRLETGDI